MTPPLTPAFVAGSRPWHDHFPRGVSPEPTPLPFASLAELVRSAAAVYPRRVAFTAVLPNGLTGSLAFEEVDRLSDAFAAWLMAPRQQVHHGDRVALILPNCLALPVCAFGTFKAGAVLVNLDPRASARELERQLRECSPRVLVVLDRYGARVTRAARAAGVPRVVTTSLGDLFPFLKSVVIGLALRLSRQLPREPHQGGGAPVRLAAALSAGALEEARRSLAAAETPGPRLRAGDLAMLQYTTGTTGPSKAAMLTHGNLLANLAQLAEVTRGCLDAEEVVLTALPLHALFAFTVSLLFPFHCGHRNVLAPDVRPVAKLRSALRARIDVTWIPAVGPLLQGLLAEDWFVADPPRRLKAVFASGAPLDADLVQRWERVTASTVLESYGLSEAGPLVTFTPAAREGLGLRRTAERVGGGDGADGRRGRRSCGGGSRAGVPLPGTDVRVVDGRGRTLGPGERGEIAVRGPQVMAGYWSRPEETVRELRNGWLFTGDAGVMDRAGWLEVRGRELDVIRINGAEVFPSRVEACLASHPEVEDAAVVGVPDELTGESVRAFVVSRNPALSPEELLAHCRPMLDAHEVPRAVSVIPALPKTPAGETLRRELRAMVVGPYAACRRAPERSQRADPAEGAAAYAGSAQDDNGGAATGGGAAAHATRSPMPATATAATATTGPSSGPPSRGGTSASGEVATPT